MPMKLRVHYAWVVLVVTFSTLLVTAGVRTLPSILIVPLETEFGWDRSAVSFAVAVSLIAFGFGAPLSGTLIDRYGPRRVMVAGLGLTALGLAPMMGLTELWHLHLLWGVIVGVGTGAISGVVGATVATRWFNKYRGVVLGALSAATAAGQLLFLPSLVAVTADSGWRTTIAVMAAAVGALLIPLALLMRDRPADVGLTPVGGDNLTTAEVKAQAKGTPLREAIRTRDFWLLAGSFFICGYTTNGLIGTHLLPHTVERGFVEVETAGALGLMGLMNIVGTIASGWLSDRYDNRKLLATYYGFRALSLLALPFIVEMRGLLIFAVIYGLDWVATVPPTVNLTAQRFGRASLGTLYGWIFCSHMIGAALAAQAGGLFRDWLGDYNIIFLSAALMGFVASTLALRISLKPQPALALETAAAD